MYGYILVSVLLSSSPSLDLADPTALIAELGASRFSRREAAEAAIARMGRAAIPMLRASRTHPDLEIRDRAAGLLRRIEASLLTEPTNILLDFNDVSLVEAMTTINQRDGLRLNLAPENPAVWAERRLTLRSAEPLPFWKAIDALCGAAGLHTVLGGQTEFDQGETGLSLYDGFASSQGLFDDRGPFRIQLTSLHYQSEVHLGSEHGETRGGTLPPSSRAGTGRATAASSRQFFLQLVVGAEPRLAIVPGGPAQVTEAIDEQGRSLVAPHRPKLIRHDSGYQGVSPSPLVHVRLDLNYPDPPATRIKRIRGTIPLVVSTRRPDPLVIPLADAASHQFRQGRMAIKVGPSQKEGPDQMTSIELNITANERAAAQADGPLAAADDPLAIASPQHLEILDAEGRMIPWFPTRSISDGATATVTLTLIDRGVVPGVPTAIRYHDLISDRTEVAFEFRDLPMP